jgi:hypothetical protein
MSDGATGEGPLISRGETRERVEHAVATEKSMLRPGWLVLALAVTSLAVTAALWMHGDITLEQALAAIFGVIITGILSGAAAYAADTNVGLAASRLVLALEAEEEPGD